MMLSVLSRVLFILMRLIRLFVKLRICLLCVMCWVRVFSRFF